MIKDQVEEMFEEPFEERDVRSLTFDELIEYRKAIGYRVYGVKLDIGIVVDRAYYMDISWECMEELADACVYIGFEIDKLRHREAKLEARRLVGVLRSLHNAASTLYSYRERMQNRFPELLKETLQDEIRAGTISEV